MAQSTLEELRKAVELLKEVEALQDEGVRVRMQKHILGLLEPMPAPAPAPEVPGLIEARQVAHSAVHTPAPPPARHKSGMPEKGTLRGRAYEAIAALATKDKPLSAPELEQVLPDDREKLSKTLSQLWGDGLLDRVQRDETARDGYERGLYKYYVNGS